MNSHTLNFVNLRYLVNLMNLLNFVNLVSPVNLAYLRHPRERKVREMFGEPIECCTIGRHLREQARVPPGDGMRHRRVTLRLDAQHASKNHLVVRSAVEQLPERVCEVAE